MHSYYRVKTSVIPNGGTDGSAVEMEAFEFSALMVPTLTSTPFRVQVSQDDGPTPTNWFDLIDGDGDVVCRHLTATTGGFVIPGEGSGAGTSWKAATACRWARVKTDNAQGAERTFSFVLKDPNAL
jgi:hypothetical protein